MVRRSSQNLINLIALQSTSGLTVSAYCEQHKISTSTFYKYKRKTELSSQALLKASFVKATVNPAQSAESEVPVDPQPTTTASITLQNNSGVWAFPATLPASYIVAVIQGLQSC